MIGVRNHPYFEGLKPSFFHGFWGPRAIDIAKGIARKWVELVILTTMSTISVKICLDLLINLRWLEKHIFPKWWWRRWFIMVEPVQKSPTKQIQVKGFRWPSLISRVIFSPQWNPFIFGHFIRVVGFFYQFVFQNKTPPRLSWEPKVPPPMPRLPPGNSRP